LDRYWYLRPDIQGIDHTWCFSHNRCDLSLSESVRRAYPHAYAMTSTPPRHALVSFQCYLVESLGFPRLVLMLPLRRVVARYIRASLTYVGSEASHKEGAEVFFNRCAHCAQSSCRCGLCALIAVDAIAAPDVRACDACSMRRVNWDERQHVREIYCCPKQYTFLDGKSACLSACTSRVVTS
jgi:hypothetical protein